MQLLNQITGIPEHPRTLSFLVLFSSLLMTTLFVVRMNADLNYDGQHYIAAAMKFSEGMYLEGLRLYSMPAYPVLIALMHEVLPNWVLAGRMISLLSLTLTLIPLYWLAKDLFGPRPAFWSCLTYILLPETLRLSNSVMRDPVFILLFVSSTYLAQHTLRSQKTTHLICTALLALTTTLFRVEGLIIFPVVLLVFLYQAAAGANNCRWHIKMALVWISIGILLMIVFGVVLGTYVPSWFNRYSDWAFYYKGFGDFSLLENYHRITDSLRQIQDSSAQRGVGHHIAETLRTWMPLFYFIGVVQMLMAVFTVSNSILLIWGLIQTEYTQSHYIVLFFVAVFIAISCCFFVRTEVILKRYLLIPSILLLPWVGFSIDRILNWVQRFSFRNLATGCILLMICGVPITGFEHFFKNTDNLAGQAGEWISQHELLRKSRIVFNDQIVKFHTEIINGRIEDEKLLLYRDPSDTDFSRFARYAKENKADAIVIQSTFTDAIDFAIQFPQYKEIKEFNSKRKSVKIYMAH